MFKKFKFNTLLLFIPLTSLVFCFNSPKNGSFYQVKKIFVPTPHCFKLSDYTKMDVAWPKVKNKVVKKTIAEVEKELGLEPGTLEIQ